MMINCIFGKSIENQRKKINVKLINDKKAYLKYVSKPIFISQKIFYKNFVAVHCLKNQLILNKTIFAGFCILELSKLLVYEFHYNYVLKTFKDVKLLFTDTDSLVYEIKNGNVYEQSFKDKHLFDFSGYPKDSVYYDDSNKRVLGKTKDEYSGVKISEFVGLKSKMHSVLLKNNSEVSKEKGINLKPRHYEYVDVLFNKKVARHKMRRILSGKHKMKTYLLNKISLSCYDDKIHILDDGMG